MVRIIRYLSKKGFDKPLLFVDHNIEYLKFKQMNKIHYSYLLKEIEKTCCEKADKIVVVSGVDKKQMMEIYGISYVLRTTLNCGIPRKQKGSSEAPSR